jgi:hypothetical protein
LIRIIDTAGVFIVLWKHYSGTDFPQQFIVLSIALGTIGSFHFVRTLSMTLYFLKARGSFLWLPGPLFISPSSPWFDNSIVLMRVSYLFLVLSIELRTMVSLFIPPYTTPSDSTGLGWQSTDFFLWLPVPLFISHCHHDLTILLFSGIPRYGLSNLFLVLSIVLRTMVPLFSPLTQLLWFYRPRLPYDPIVLHNNRLSKNNWNFPREQ